MAQGMVEQSWDAPEDWFMTNLVTQSKIIKQIHNFKFIKKYINFSTPEVYGNNSKWQKESFDFMPTTPYAISRASFDLYLKNMYENFNFPIIITRASNIYGPTQQLFRIIPRTILFGLNKTKLIIDGDGKTTRSFIHMNDVSKALLKIIDKGKNGETYHISSNDLITIDALVKKICKVLGINLEISYGPERVGKDKYYKLKTTKIRKLGWKDIISLEEGIIETSNWLKHINKKIIKKDNIYYKHIK